MSIKVIFLGILAIVAGISFIASGVYFLSPNFIDKLNKSNSDKRNEFRARGSGFTAISLGALTIVWALMLFTFPQIAPALALVYMVFLIAAFGVLMVVYK